MNKSARCLSGAAAASLLAATIFLPAAALGDQTPAFWQSQSIYQVVTDRYFDGDPSNNNADGNYDPAGHSGTSVHGGDFKGLEEKLDYIKSLGATAIWISPVVLNANGEFHGYAGRDFYKVDPHWGSLADLQHFIQAAHARGLLVIDDIIVNHRGDLIYSTDSGYGNFLYPPSGYNLRYRNSSKTYPPPFDLDATNTTLTALFHNNGTIQNYGDDTQVVLGEQSGLDDFRTETPYVRARMTEIYEYWIGQAGFDGFRIDTVKHVEMGFWQTWCPAVHAYAATNGHPNFFMFGEVYDGSDAKCGSYTGTQGGGPFKLDSVLDYPLYFLVNSVFATASGDTAQIENRYAALAANYDPSAQNRLVTFLDNHDQARFLSSGNANNNTDRLKVGLVFLYTARGIPCLYYGTEQGFNGGTDPYDREDMFAGQFKDGPAGVDSFNMTHPLFQWVAKLNNLRRLYPALLTGSHVNLWSDSDGPGLFAYVRRLGTQEVFVVVNTASSSQTLPSRPTICPAGTTLVNLLDTNETVTVVAGPQTPPITVPGTSSKVFIAQSQWLPLDPVVTGITPAHGATGVLAGAPVVIQFSQPMDTGSVVSAFSTLPAASGRFLWSPTRDKLTFAPSSAAFPTQSLVTVRIAATARAASGSAFHAAFESRFKTGTSTAVPVTGNYLQRISGGNPADVTGCSGNVWVRDQAYSPGSFGYSDGTTGYIANTITGICASAQSLYQRERYSTSAAGFRYLFGCPAGIYEITLLEADTWVSGPGQRMFNVFIEGQQVLTNFDIYVAAGGKNLPLTRVFTNTVSDGQLEILFQPLVDNARVSGIQVRKIGDLFSGNDGIPDWWRVAYFGHATGEAADLSRAGDDADGDGMSNMTEYLAGTDPLDANSVFKFTAVTQAGDEVQLAWATRTNKTYQLQQTDALGGAAGWSDLGPSLAGIDGVITQSVGAPAGEVHFFRVQAH